MSGVVIVCGGREGQKPLGVVARALKHWHRVHGPIAHLITGSDRGTDWQAFKWAMNCEVMATIVPAHWSAYGGRAGPIRNRRMLTAWTPHAVLAFPGGPGTADMIRAVSEPAYGGRTAVWRCWVDENKGVFVWSEAEPCLER